MRTKRTAVEARVEAARAAAAGVMIAVRDSFNKHGLATGIIVARAAMNAFMESAEELKDYPEVCKIYSGVADELAAIVEDMNKTEAATMLQGLNKNEEEPEAEPVAEPEAEPEAESTQNDRARAAYLNTCDECEAIEATGTREAVHEAKKLRTLAAEALAHYLRTHDAEWVEELETLQREAFAYSPDGLQDRRSGAEGTGYHPIE